MTIQCLKKKVLKCIWVRKVVDIGLLIPATFPQVIVEVTDIGLLRPPSLPIVIARGTLVDTVLGHKRPDNTPFKIG